MHSHINIVLLTIAVALLPSGIMRAAGTMSDQLAVPVTGHSCQMRSTSAMLASRQIQPIRPATKNQSVGNAPVFTYMVSKNIAKRERSWTIDNLLQAGQMMNSGSNYASGVATNSAPASSYAPSVRRGPGSGGTGGTDVPQPTIQPIGDGCWILLLLICMYMLKIRYQSRKNTHLQKSVNNR